MSVFNSANFTTPDFNAWNFSNFSENNGLPSLNELVETSFPRIDETTSPEKADPYTTFLTLINDIKDYEDTFVEDLSDTIDIDFLNFDSDMVILKDKIPPEDMQMLSDLLEWMYLLILGYLPQQNNIKSIKKHLGIHDFIEILDTKIPIGPENNTLQKLHNFIYQSEKIEAKTEITKILLTQFDEQFSDLLVTDKILFEIDAVSETFDKEYLKQFSEIFYDMNLESRLRWRLFIEVAFYQLKDKTESIAPKPFFRIPINIPNKLVPLLKKMDEEFRSKSPNEKAESQATFQEFYPNKPTSFVTPSDAQNPLKKENPDFPNWMPNGLNSCYISSSLWGLFFVINQEIQEKVQSFPNENIEKSSPEQNAKSEFRKLYDLLSARNSKFIKKEHVNNFREAMQKAFPIAFLYPDRKSQEDAYDFMIYVLTSLLDLDSCSQDNPKKFVKYHTFSRVDDYPLIDHDIYDYTEAFKPVLRTEPLPVIDIRLEEGEQEIQSFKSLVNMPRSRIEKRSVYKPGQISGPHQSINANFTEQLMVTSRENAPDYFIGRITRFNEENGIQTKRKDPVLPSATLDIPISDSIDETVAYDFAAVVIHSGNTIQSGHYYTYFRKEINGEWKYYKFDDIAGTKECEDPISVMKDAATNDYILCYKKRGDGQPLPPPLPMENEFEEQKALLKVFEKQKEILKNIEKKEKIQSTPEIKEEIQLIPEKYQEIQAVPAIKMEISRKRKREKFEDNVDESQTDKMDAESDISDQRKNLDLQEAQDWCNENILAAFTMDPRGYFTLDELLKTVFNFEGNTNQTKRSTTRDRQLLVSASQALQRPIFLIDPSNDDVQVLDGVFIVPSEQFCIGVDFISEPIYIFRQANRVCTCINIS